MGKRSRGVLHWAPRVLGLLFPLFVALFALDVFGQGQGFWRTALARRDSSGSNYYYHHDALGSINGLSNGTSIYKSYLYEEFGDSLGAWGSSPYNTYRYTGQEYDGKPAYAYNLRARIYYPKLGRFMQNDPIGNNGGSLNWYTYVANNPINWIDPSGRDNVGCDGIPDYLETPCILECCAAHDECYDKNNCSSSSWYKKCSSECDECNKKVKSCIYKCGFSKKDDPNKPNNYCRRLHRYIKIPGDFPDYSTAKQNCSNN